MLRYLCQKGLTRLGCYVQKTTMEIHRKKIHPNYLGAVDKKGYVEENFVVFKVKFFSALETTVQLVQQKFDRFSHTSGQTRDIRYRATGVRREGE